MTCPSCGKELISTGIYLREEDLTTLEFLNYKEEAAKQVESLLMKRFFYDIFSNFQLPQS